MANKSIIIQGQPPAHEQFSTLYNNISDVSKPIAIQDNEDRSQDSPQRLQDLDYVNNGIGK